MDANMVLQKDSEIRSLCNKSLDNSVVKDFDEPEKFGKYFFANDSSSLSDIDDEIALKLSINTVKITYNDRRADHRQVRKTVSYVLNRDYKLA